MPQQQTRKKPHKHLTHQPQTPPKKPLHHQKPPKKPLRPRKTTTNPPPPPPTTTTTTLSPALQSAVNSLTSGGAAAVAADKAADLSPAVLRTLKQDFEQKKNIFAQFVVFDETDSPFLPASKVSTTDWTRIDTPTQQGAQGIRNIPAPDLGRSGAPAAAAEDAKPATAESRSAAVANTAAVETKKKKLFGDDDDVEKFPSERNAEGGFIPMLRPLHRPLLNN